MNIFFAYSHDNEQHISAVNMHFIEVALILQVAQSSHLTPVIGAACFTENQNGI